MSSHKQFFLHIYHSVHILLDHNGFNSPRNWNPPRQLSISLIPSTPRSPEPLCTVPSVHRSGAAPSDSSSSAALPSAPTLPFPRWSPRPLGSRRPRAGAAAARPTGAAWLGQAGAAARRGSRSDTNQGASGGRGGPIRASCSSAHLPPPSRASRFSPPAASSDARAYSSWRPRCPRRSRTTSCSRRPGTSHACTCRLYTVCTMVHSSHR